jgi:hypothetical protein
MNWDAVGAVAELLGALGVIITLAYLATQIRQNTQTVRAQGAASQFSAQSSVGLLLAQDDVISELYFRGLERFSSLSDAEKRRFLSTIGLHVSGLQQSFYLRQEQALSDDQWDQVERDIHWLSAKEGFIAYMQQYGPQYSPNFQHHVDEQIRSSQTGT